MAALAAAVVPAAAASSGGAAPSMAALSILSSVPLRERITTSPLINEQSDYADPEEPSAWLPFLTCGGAAICSIVSRHQLQVFDDEASGRLRPLFYRAEIDHEELEHNDLDNGTDLCNVSNEAVPCTSARAPVAASDIYNGTNFKVTVPGGESSTSPPTNDSDLDVGTIFRSDNGTNFSIDSDLDVGTLFRLPQSQLPSTHRDQSADFIFRDIEGGLSDDDRLDELSYAESDWKPIDGGLSDDDRHVELSDAEFDCKAVDFGMHYCKPVS